MFTLITFLYSNRTPVSLLRSSTLVNLTYYDLFQVQVQNGHAADHYLKALAERESKIQREEDAINWKIAAVNSNPERFVCSKRRVDEIILQDSFSNAVLVFD